MSVLIKKRQLLAASLVIALAAAVTVNWYYSKSDVKVSDESSISDESVQGHLGDSLLVAGTAVENAEETTEGESQPTQTVAKFFADATLKKNEYIDSIKDEIEDLIESDNLDSESKGKVTSLLNKLNDAVKAETDCETLIKAKLGGDCVVIIKDNSAEVIVEKGKLDDNSLMQITEIIEKNANVTAENLTIIEAK